jgi:hypothetical protein
MGSGIQTKPEIAGINAGVGLYKSLFFGVDGMGWGYGA